PNATADTVAPATPLRVAPAPCKNNATSKIAPRRMAASRKCVRYADDRAQLSNTVKSTNGELRRRCRRTNTGAATRKTAAATRTSGAVQRRVAAGDSAVTSPPRISNDSTALTKSKASVRGGRGTRRNDTSAQTTPSTPPGTLNQNTARQPNSCARNPPIDGP